MLQHLHIRNFAIVPSLEQEFQSGFSAISGETGAGKSILVDALGLLVGSRSDSSWVKAGEERAELTAAFNLSGNPMAREWLEQQEMLSDDECLLRRTIQASGRSRAWINGTPVTVQQLGELGQLLVEIHGQNEHVRLTGQARQRELLDQTGSYPEQMLTVAETYNDWKQAQEDLDHLQNTAFASPRELELMRFQLEELNQSALPADRLAELVQEHQLLARSGELLETLNLASTIMDSDETGLLAQLNLTLASLESFGELDPVIAETRTLLEESRINCQEALSNLQNVSSGVDLSPDRLTSVEQQLSTLNTLARKHGVEMEGLEALAEEMTRQLQANEGYDDQLEQFQAQVDSALKKYRQAAKKLSACRSNHAAELVSEVNERMGELGMQGGEFAIDITLDTKAKPSPSGCDQLSVKVSANPGTPPGPLSKVASGGELSRISLAIKVAASGAAEGRLQVFDEIDTGIGGDTAHAVGRLLGKAANGSQALCVTHLAQVAVCAAHQLKVSKQPGKDSTGVSAQWLAETEREQEIARMLGGSVSDHSLAHARELLDAADQTR